MLFFTDDFFPSCPLVHFAARLLCGDSLWSPGGVTRFRLLRVCCALSKFLDFFVTLRELT